MQQSIWSGFLVAAAAMVLLVGGRTAMAGAKGVPVPAELGEPVTYRCAGGRQLGDAQGRWQTVLDRCQSAVD